MAHGNRKGCFKDVKQRLLDRHIVDQETGCWLWTGALMPNGYGYMGVRGKNQYTHRAAYEEFVGPIPSGLFVLHNCDVRNCINPNHLRVGTHQDNVDDKVLRNRQAKNARSMNTRNKLSRDDVLAIRNDKRTAREIAADYHVSQGHIYRIKRRRQWHHVQ